MYEKNANLQQDAPAILFIDAHQDRTVVADASKIPWTGVSPERFFPGMGGVALRQERRFHHTERSLVRKRWRDEAQVDQLPLPVETDAALSP